MKLSIFIVLTTLLAVSKGDHSEQSERPKFPGNFIPVPSPPISYSRNVAHDDTLAKPTAILGKKMFHVFAYQYSA